MSTLAIHATIRISVDIDQSAHAAKITALFTSPGMANGQSFLRIEHHKARDGSGMTHKIWQATSTHGILESNAVLRGTGNIANAFHSILAGPCTAPVECTPTEATEIAIRAYREILPQLRVVAD